MCFIRRLHDTLVLVFGIASFCGFYLYESNTVCAKTIHVAWLAPEKKYSYFNASSSVGALALALEDVMERNILPGYNFSVTWIDSDCSSKLSIGKLVDLLYNGKVDFVLGPPCTDAMIPVAELAAYRNIPVFSWSSNSNKLDNKNSYSTLVRTLPPVSSVGGLFVSVFYAFNWTRAVMMSTRDLQQSDLADSIEVIFEYYSGLGLRLIRHYSAIDQVVDEDTIRTMYTSVKREARRRTQKTSPTVRMRWRMLYVVILVVPRSELRKYLLVAQEMRMVDGAYQFLFTRQEIMDEEELELIQSTALWQREDGRDAEAREAFKNLLFIALGGTEGNFTSFTEQTFQAMTKEPWVSVLPKPSVPDEYSPFLYDAVTLYCLAFKSCLMKGQEPTGECIRTEANGVRFSGKTGDVSMTPGSDRQPIFWIFDLGLEGNFNLALAIAYTMKNGTVTMNVDYRGAIRWGDGGVFTATNPYVPSDIPVCGFDNELCPEEINNLVEILVPAVVGALFGFTAIVLIMVYRWIRFERELANMIWKIPYDDLKFIEWRRGRPVMGSVHTGLPSQSLTSLVSRTESGDKQIISSAIGSLALSVSGGGSLGGAQMFIAVACLHGNPVAVKDVRKHKIKIDRDLQKEMKTMLEMKHGNLATFVGVCVEHPHICALWEYCSKGSLQDVIENDNIKLDTMFKLSLAADICKGIDYIHKSLIQVHGNLKSSNCVIDNRWTCKLTDFGLTIFKHGEEEDPEQAADHARYARLFWTAPETLRLLLRLPSKRAEKTQEGDIYSFGIVAKELLCRNGPYFEESHLLPKEIIERIVQFDTDHPFRPTIDKDIELSSTNNGRGKSGQVVDLVQQCWSEDPALRPNIKAVMRKLNSVNPYKKTNVLDNMITLMEKYSSHLEELVSERTEQLEEEKKKTDTLLYRMLPKSVAENLKLGKSVEAEIFEDVTIYFSDIVGFTKLAGESTPMQVVDLLNSLYTLFDDIVSKYDVYKVETIGDAYMLVSGLPVRNGPGHVKEIADVSLDILSAVSDFKIPHDTERQLQIRIGLHSGSAVAGVVGLTMPRYCLFGDTVNTASRMESTGQASKIHMSSFTYAALATYPGYHMLDRGEIEIKGKGKMRTYWLVGKDGFQREMSSKTASVCAEEYCNEIENGEEVKSRTPARYEILTGTRDKEQPVRSPDIHMSEHRKYSNLFQSQEDCNDIAAVETPESEIKLPRWAPQPHRKSLLPLNGTVIKPKEDSAAITHFQEDGEHVKLKFHGKLDLDWNTADRRTGTQNSEAPRKQKLPLVHIPAFPAMADIDIEGDLTLKL